MEKQSLREIVHPLQPAHTVVTRLPREQAIDGFMFGGLAFAQGMFEFMDTPLPKRCSWPKPCCASCPDLSELQRVIN